MKVLSAPGTRCPMEGQPRKYINDNRPVDVPGTSYYRRLLAEGSLLPAPSTKPAKAAPRKKAKAKEKQS